MDVLIARGLGVLEVGVECRGLVVLCVGGGGAPNCLTRLTNTSRRRLGHLQWTREGCEARAAGILAESVRLWTVDCGLRVCCRGAAELRARCGDLDGD